MNDMGDVVKELLEKYGYAPVKEVQHDHKEIQIFKVFR